MLIKCCDHVFRRGLSRLDPLGRWLAGHHISAMVCQPGEAPSDRASPLSEAINGILLWSVST